MLTGGFKTSKQAAEAIATGLADIVGLARAHVIEPSLAELWNSEQEFEPTFPRFASAPEGGITAWYTMRITAITTDDENDFDLDLHTAINTYEERDKTRCARWQAKFI